MHEHKEILRNQLRTRRQALAPGEAASLSEQIVHNAVGTIDWAAITSLHIYQPIAHQQEIDTTLLFRIVWQQYPAIETATWKKTEGGYKAFWLDAAGFGAPVPKGQQFGAIIVPLLGFNDAGHRIGFGGGFYDRFLAAQPGAITIGLCYEFGYTATFRPEPHDVPLTYIVTEKQAKRFAISH